MPRTKKLNSNVAAFLDMLAVSEGTANKGDDGYNMIVGGKLFDSYKDHPRKLINLPRLGIKSTAAGRYQLLERYYDAYKEKLNLSNFSPESQDAIAWQQIAEQGAMSDVIVGNFESAVIKCNNIWASLPGAGYGQHENSMDKLKSVYLILGGSLA